MNAKDWVSERILFGLLIIGGFFGLYVLVALMKLGSDQLQTIKDGLLVVGPLLGVIVQSIWKADRVDRQVADTAAVLAAKAPDQSGAPLVAPAAAPAALAPEPTVL